ncbi:MAG: ATP-binding cassette domain-containing protein [Mobilicoccus sp.]|nr:ATP-binding cassette domain-containing protein [Mobilicoccus sp.]
MIQFSRVVKTYPRSSRPALDGIDLTVEAGEFVFLVGPSGSGKSTLVGLMLREEKVTSGGLVVAGRDLTKISRRATSRLRREVGAVFQDFRLLPDKTVGENVAYVLHVLGEKPQHVREAVPQALEKVGLAGLERRRPHELSGGEQQRVAIARALVRKPALLLADEPTGNLDPATSLELVRLLEDINADGTTVVMGTHDDRIVDTLRRRVVQLDSGRIVRDEAAGLYLHAPDRPDKTSGPPVTGEVDGPDQPDRSVPTEEPDLKPASNTLDSSPTPTPTSTSTSAPTSTTTEEETR